VDTFRSFVGREPLDEVRKELQGMVGKRVSIPEIKSVFWAVTDVHRLADFWFELRASGTDAVLRFYIEGKEKAFLTR